MCATPKTLRLKKQQRSTTQSMKQIRRRRKVSFSSKVIIVENEDHNSSTVLQHSQNASSDNSTWYSLSELEDIKESVKEEAKKYRILSSKAVSSQPTQSSLVLPFRNCGVYKKMKYLVKVQQILDDDSSHSSSKKNIPEFRGLEGRIFVERQRNKSMAMTTVMEYQRRTEILIDEARKNHKSESDIELMKQTFATRLSTICVQLSQWALDEALSAARYDAEGIFALPSKRSDDENEMMKLVKKRSKWSETNSRSISTASSKRKLSSITNNNNISTWGQQQRQMKQPRLTMGDIYVPL